MYEDLIGKYVVIGYGNYGLRAGVLEAVEGTTARLRNSRHIFYFAAQPKTVKAQGVEALQSVGPAKGSKLGPVTEITVVNNVRRVGSCTSDAQAAFEAASWDQ